MKCLTVVQDDGSKWAVPIDVIAKNRAAEYAHEFDGDVEKSLAEDTMPLFEDDYEIEDWAVNNMNWSDVAHAAFKCEEAPPPNFEHAWMDGIKEVENIDTAAMRVTQ